MTIEGTSHGGRGVGEAIAAVGATMNDECAVTNEAGVGELHSCAPRHSLVTPTRA
jgi:hypothetical protein